MFERIFPSIQLHRERMQRLIAEEITSRKAAEAIGEAIPAFAQDPDEKQWNTSGTGRQPLDYTESDLSDMWTAALELSYHPGGRGLLDTMESFVIGESTKVIAQDENPEVQEYWDNWAKMRKWETRCKEAFRRFLRDGDTFFRWFKPPEVLDGKKYLLTRFVEPNEIMAPTGADPTYTFGIKTDPEDIEKVMEYHRVYMKGTTQTEETIPAAEIDHFKHGVDSNVKRGLSWLMGVAKYIRLHEQWLDFRIQLNRLRTLWAVKGNVTGSGGSSISDIKNKFTDTTGKTVSGEGTPKKMPSAPMVWLQKGIDWEMDALNINASDAAEDGRNIQLMICAGTGLTEYVVRGDSSNSNFSCHDETTEYLTERGWVGITDITEQDRVGTMNPETGMLEFQQVQAVHLSRYDGPMIQATGAHSINFCVTPNHRMYIRMRRFERKGGRKGRLLQNGHHPWKFVEAGNLNGHQYNVVNHVAGFAGENPADFVLPGIDRTQYPRREDRTIPMPLWLEFLGYFISEGWILDNGSKRWTIGLSQKKGPTADKIRTCLNKMPIIWQEYGPREHGMIVWQVFDKALWHWIKENVGSGALNKHIPPFIQTLDSSVLETLLQALVDGDGSRRATATKGTTMYYYTASKQLADDILILALKAGYDASLATRMKNAYGGIYPVNIKKPRPARLYPKRHCTTTEYSGLVGCVTVPNGLIVTRRNGKVAVHGNSTMVSESPMVKMFEKYQDFVRYMTETAYARVIRYGIETDALPAKSTKTIEGQLRNAKRRYNNALREGRIHLVEDIAADIAKLLKQKDGPDQTPDEPKPPKPVKVIPEPKKEEVPTSTECQVEFPPLIHRDVLQETTALAIHQDRKWASRQTCSASMGYDYEQEKKEIEKDEATETDTAKQQDRNDWGGGQQ